MALFQSGNPTLTEKNFNQTFDVSTEGIMTVRGTIQKFGFLLLMVIAGALYTWHLYDEFKMDTMTTMLWVGLFGGIVSALIISFKPRTAQYLAPVYGILEGFVLGALSAIINEMFKAKYPGIITQAVGLTFGVAFGMFLLYNFRIIKPTEKFKSVIISSIFGISILYGVTILLSFFGVHLSFMSITDASPLGIGINLFVVAIAALTLILDFERIEMGAATGAPKHMEWYGAFGLLVTIVWLYIEILKLLSRFASSRK